MADAPGTARRRGFMRAGSRGILKVALIVGLVSGCSFDTTVADLGTNREVAPDAPRRDAAGDGPANKDQPQAIEASGNDGPGTDAPRLDTPRRDAPGDKPRSETGPAPDVALDHGPPPAPDGRTPDGPKADVPKPDTLKADTLRADTLKTDLKPDTGPPPFTVTWYASATSTASCPLAGQYAIAGGGTCQTSYRLSGSTLSGSTGWVTGCITGGGSAATIRSTYVGCANQAPTYITTGAPRTCSNSPTTPDLLGGECQCAGSIHSFGPKGSEWTCRCFPGNSPTKWSAACGQIPTPATVTVVPAAAPTGVDITNTASCPAGSIGLGGGCVITAQPSSVDIVSSVPTFDNPLPGPATGWQCAFANTTGCSTSAPCYAAVICYKPP